MGVSIFIYWLHYDDLFCIGKDEKARAKTSALWALGVMVFNVIWFLLFR